ncbi:hypothetical protein NONO_c47290 [Nocardia nova SH22a]|uniref:Uncharacterized protein n=1 Tax=Nocardia nova SH22a TaxID=1415166 RepID=W5TKN0_9NOCA|nr:hypothetical protein NONO_c47290 [Nocardia nova SH22a]
MTSGRQNPIGGRRCRPPRGGRHVRTRCGRHKPLGGRRRAGIGFRRCLRSGSGRCGNPRRVGYRGAEPRRQRTTQSHRDRNAPQTFHDNTPVLSEWYSNRGRAAVEQSRSPGSASAAADAAPISKHTPGPGKIVGSASTCLARVSSDAPRGQGRKNRANLDDSTGIPDNTAQSARFIRHDGRSHCERLDRRQWEFAGTVSPRPAIRRAHSLFREPPRHGRPRRRSPWRPRSPPDDGG